MADFGITINDYTCYEWQKSRNGGAYSFHEEATIRNGQITDGHHWTSAEFDYCSNCGRFESNMRDHEEQWCFEGYQPSNAMENAVREVDIALETGEDAEAAAKALFSGEYEINIISLERKE